MFRAVGNTVHRYQRFLHPFANHWHELSFTSFKFFTLLSRQHKTRREQEWEDYTWFTFSLRQHEMRRERECEVYFCLVCHILNLLLSHLEALRNMLVNQSRVKWNKNVSSCYRRYCDFILIQFSNIDGIVTSKIQTPYFNLLSICMHFF